MENIDDREIAKKAAKMLSAALRSKTGSFAEHVNRPADKASLKDSEAVSRLKKYGLVKNGNKQFYLRAVSIKMPKHGFIRHYGVNHRRAAGQRTRKDPKITTYSFKDHMMNQTAKPFLTQAIDTSGVLPYVTNAIAENRANEVAQNIVVTLRQFK